MFRELALSEVSFVYDQDRQRLEILPVDASTQLEDDEVGRLIGWLIECAVTSSRKQPAGPRHQGDDQDRQ